MQSYLFFNYKRSISMNIIGSNYIVLNEINSTNEYASNLLSQFKQLDGTIVLTNYQTNGKGQANNIWISEKGRNLLISIILYPKFLTIERQFCLSMAISLGILNTIKTFTKSDVKVKWPNDIIVDEKKIAGVLIKNTISGNRIKNTIVGIGININQKDFKSLKDIAVSLSLIENKIFDLKYILKILIKNLNIYYNKLSLLQVDKLKAEYEENLFRINELTTFQIPSKESLNAKIIKGKITGVDNYGKLCVLSDGKIKTFMHKEIAFTKK